MTFLARIPGSRSITARALVCASLGRAEVSLRGVAECDDAWAIADCLTGLGSRIVGEEERYRVTPVDALGGGALNCRASGTTLRFMSALTVLVPDEVVLTGTPRLLQRPMGPLVDVLGHLGKQVDTAGSEIRISGIADVPEEVTLDASASGQFVSGMMMACGRLEGARRIRALRPRSVPFIQMTVDVMAAFGQPVDVSQHGNDLELHIPGGGYSAAAFDVEPDVMSANYLLAAPLVLGRAVTVEGISRDTSQGDAGMIDVLAQMGATVSWAGEQVTISHEATALHGVSADLRDMPDMSLTLGVLAALANQPSTFTGVANLRHKESDRLAVLHNELSRLGCHVDIAPDDDTIRITPMTGPVPDVVIETYDDHRVAMAFGLLTLRNPRLVIKNPACVEKTWPGYFDELARYHESPDGVPAVS